MWLVDVSSGTTDAIASTDFTEREYQHTAQPGLCSSDRLSGARTDAAQTSKRTSESSSARRAITKSRAKKERGVACRPASINKRAFPLARITRRLLHRSLHEQVRVECIWIHQSVSYKFMRDTCAGDFCMVRL